MSIFEVLGLDLLVVRNQRELGLEVLICNKIVALELGEDLLSFEQPVIKPISQFLSSFDSVVILKSLLDHTCTC